MKGMEKKRLLTSKGKSETQRRGHRKCRGPRRLLTVEPVFLLFCLGWMLHRSVLKQHVFNWYSREQSSDQLNNTALYNISTSTHWPMLMQNTSRNVTLTSAVDKTRHFMISRGAASLLPAVLSTLFFGSLSDKIGYKPIILLSALFGSMTAFVEILAIHMNWSLHVFLVFSALSAVGGSLPLMRTVVFSYVANSSSVRWRTLRFGFLELMVFVGAATNLLTSSVWVQNTEFKFVYLLLVTIGTNVAMAFYAIYVLRTSIEREERDDIVRKYSSSYRHIFRGLVIILKIRSRWRLWSSLVVASVVDFTIYGFVQISGKFLSSPPLAWGQGTITKLSVGSETTAILSLMILLPVLVFINIPDTVLVVCGVLWSAICYILMGMSIKSWQVFTIGTVLGLSSITEPMVSSSMSKLVEQKEQGALFSVIFSSSAVDEILSSTIVFYLYPIALEQGWKPGTIFFPLAGLLLMLLPLFVARFLTRKCVIQEEVSRVRTNPLDLSIIDSDQDGTLQYKTFSSAASYR